MRFENEGEALGLCPLFSGLSDTEIDEALKFYSAKRQVYQKGDTLLARMSAVERFALVVTGTVQVMTDDINGHHMIMATVQKGQTFAESLCFRRCKESPVYACALSACEIIWLRADVFGTGPAARLLNLLTAKTLSMNDRIQVLSKLTLRDKLLTLFSQYTPDAAGTITLPFDREDMAAYLGCNRSALSREMSKMRREGLIDFDGNRISLKPQ